MTLDRTFRFAKISKIALVLFAIALMLAPATFADDQPWVALGIDMDSSWDEIADGVFQRTGPGGTETRAFGTEGLAWGLDQLEAELVNLTRIYVADPSDLNRGHLEAHLGAISELQTELHARATRSYEKRAKEDVEAAPPCNPNVIYTADADAGVNFSEVWATSEAYYTAIHNFGPYCPGTAYARAHAETTSGGFVYSDTDLCSKTQTTASCDASASIFKVSNCHSNSYAYASYPPWGYFTSQSATQTGCM